MPNSSVAVVQSHSWSCAVQTCILDHTLVLLVGSPTALYNVIIGGDIINDKRFRLLRLTLPFRGLVCLSISYVRALCSNGRRHRQISPRSRKSMVFIGQPFFPKFCPKLTTPVYLSVGDIRWQIAAERLEIAQSSQWRSYIGNHHRSF